jgi:hypothetical protein
VDEKSSEKEAVLSSKVGTVDSVFHNDSDLAISKKQKQKNKRRRKRTKEKQK